MTSIARTGEPRVRPLLYYYKLIFVIKLWAMTSIARTGEPRVRPLLYYYKLTPLKVNYKLDIWVV